MEARAAKRHRFAVSRHTDFEVGGPRAWNGGLEGHAPYALDGRAGRLWLTDAPRTILDEPFLYAAQLDAATRVLAARPEDLLRGLPAIDWRAAAPLFVLSIGRCGSTLTTRMLRRSGWRGLSEPDVFDLATWDMEPGRTDRALHAAASAWAAFARATPERTAFKLRSDLSSHVHVLRRAFPAARFLFLTRKVEPWAHSFVRAFGVRNAHLAGTLLHARACLRHLVRTEARLAVLDYETLAAEPSALGRALIELGYAAPRGLVVEREHVQSSERNEFEAMTPGKRAQVARFIAAAPPAPVPDEARPFVVT